MNNIDIILGAFLCIGIVQGFLKGFVWEVASFVSIFIALWGAIHFSSAVAGFLSETFSLSVRTNQVISFVITFLLILILVGLTGKLLTKILESVALGFLNRVAGAVFGVLKWSMIVGTALMYLNNGIIEIIPQETTEQSIFYKPIIEMNTWVRTHIFHYKNALPNLSPPTLSTDER